MQELKINHHYNFSVHANSILGVNYIGAKLISILDFNTALKFDNVLLLNKQIYPYLPPGTLADSSKYTYYLFEYNGKKVVVADVWIVENSVELSQGVTYTLKLNNITSVQLGVIRDQLTLLGISFDIL